MNRRGILGLGAAAMAFPGMTFAGGSRGSRMFDVREYGARGDGKTKDTGAIQKAIAAAFKAGGGVAYVGPGVYLSGSIVLKDNVTLYLEAGSTLLTSRDMRDFEPQLGEDPHATDNVRHLIFARDAV
ncbi:MAG TPA: glycosyl hydrolase family 28-related protein, partial [Terriglobia bacterium]|nr:glycosyl hydrolase family 28-related protein [Terriglobia bacterium]